MGSTGVLLCCSILCILTCHASFKRRELHLGIKNFADLFATSKKLTTQLYDVTNLADLNRQNGGNTNPCLSEQFVINSVCNVNWTTGTSLSVNLTLEELSTKLFDLEKVHLLMASCMAGQWCLDSEVSWPDMSSDVLSFCEEQGCLSEIPQSCLSKERALLISTLRLYCEAHQNNVTMHCLRALRKLTHVTLADIYRNEDQLNSACSEGFYQNSCIGPCFTLGHDIECTREQCTEHPDILTHMEQWTWYFDADGQHRSLCSNITNCTHYEPPSADSSWLIDFWNAGSNKLLSREPMDFKVLSGIVTMTAVCLGVIMIIIWACIKRANRKLVYERNLVEYSEVGDIEHTTLFSLDNKEEYEQLT